MLVAIQYISFSQCSAQASLSEYSELQYSSAATNHLHTISESPLLTLPSLYYHSVHDPLLYYPVIKSDITTRRKYEPCSCEILSFLSFFSFCGLRVTNQLSTGAILNNQKAMEYNAQTGTLQCNFNFMQLKKIKRSSERRAAETVTEQNFPLL